MRDDLPQVSSFLYWTCMRMPIVIWEKGNFILFASSWWCIFIKISYKSLAARWLMHLSKKMTPIICFFREHSAPSIFLRWWWLVDKLIDLMYTILIISEPSYYIVPFFVYTEVSGSNSYGVRLISCGPGKEVSLHFEHVNNRTRTLDTSGRSLYPQEG